MSFTSNKFTKQPPLPGATVRAVLAERVYIAPSGTLYADPTARLNGTDPAAPWEDLGILRDSRANLSYQKEIRYIETGIEKVRRGAYSLGKTAEVTFTLEQYDIEQLELVTGVAAQAVNDAGSPVASIGDKIYMGQEDIVEAALLFVGVNKVDGKEYHHYTQRGVLTFNIAQEDDFRVLNVTANLYPFVDTGETEEAYFKLIVLDTPA